jgi:hypothetical protein
MSTIFVLFDQNYLVLFKCHVCLIAHLDETKKTSLKTINECQGPGKLT